MKRELFWTVTIPGMNRRSPGTYLGPAAKKGQRIQIGACWYTVKKVHPEELLIEVEVPDSLAIVLPMVWIRNQILIDRKRARRRQLPEY